MGLPNQPRINNRVVLKFWITFFTCQINIENVTTGLKLSAFRNKFLEITLCVPEWADLVTAAGLPSGAVVVAALVGRAHTRRTFTGNSWNTQMFQLVGIHYSGSGCLPTGWTTSSCTHWRTFLIHKIQFKNSLPTLVILRLFIPLYLFCQENWPINSKTHVILYLHTVMSPNFLVYINYPY